MPSASGALRLLLANQLRLANQDLKDALLLRDAKSRNSTYHLEQAAEKLLHALLTAEGISVGVEASHKLEVLVDRLPPEHPLKSALGQLAYLRSYATAYRYPKSGGRLPTELDPRKEAAAAKALR